MTIKVIDRESHFTIGDFHIEVDTLEEDGRTRYGALIYERREGEEWQRRSLATPVCKTKPAAVSAGWVRLLEICGDVHDRERAFVARKKQCGCICAAIVWDHYDDLLPSISRWSKDCHIDLVTHDEVRSGFTGWDCPHEAPLLKLMENQS